MSRTSFILNANKIVEVVGSVYMLIKAKTLIASIGDENSLISKLASYNHRNRSSNFMLFGSGLNERIKVCLIKHIIHSVKMELVIVAFDKYVSDSGFLAMLISLASTASRR